MLVKINNYKNIKNLEIEFIDNKINFVYGISGSGKSSIIEALLDDEPSNNLKFGTDIASQVINVSPILDKTNIDIFNEDNKRLFLQNVDENTYKVLFSNDDSVIEIHNDLLSLYKDMTSLIPDLNNYLNNIADLRKELGLRKNYSNVNSSTCIIKKIEDEANSPDYRINYLFVKKYGLDYLKWIIEGTNYPAYSNNKCPFCERKLTDSRKNKVDSIVDLTPDNYKALISSNTYINIFGIEEPNYSNKRDINRIKKKIDNIFKTENEVLNLLKTLESFNTQNVDYNSLTKIKVSKNLEEQLPNISLAIENYNNNIQLIKRDAKILEKRTTKLIKKNLDSLNNYLEILGIPYEFIVKEYNITYKEANTFLVHVDSNKDKDNRACLSYGESNILSLLLFILCLDKDYAIIDDPASSFDETRRTIIYNMIMDNCNKKTVIVLSHDQSFIINAIINKKCKRNIDKIGVIYYLSNNDDTTISSIDINDFKNIFEHIEEYINNNDLSYYQLIINSRILSEKLNRESNSKNKIIYGYLSAILHRKSSEEINNILSSYNYTESEILDLISKKLNIVIPPKPDDILEDFDYSKLTSFEKIAYKREVLDKRTSDSKTLRKYTKDVFSEIVHLTSTNILTLNPYKYSNYPKNIINIINEE